MPCKGKKKPVPRKQVRMRKSETLMLISLLMVLASVSGCKESGQTSYYAAKPDRTIKATIITEYVVKPEMPFRIATSTIASIGMSSLPHERRYCGKCVGWFVKKNRLIKEYIDNTSNRLTIETKNITRPKSKLSCNKTLSTQTCMNTLYDGCVIKQFQWEKE